VIEAVIGVPAFMLFVALIVFAGRVAIAHQGVQSAAADAARSASIARTQGGAQTAGTVTCDVNLSDLFLPGVPGSKAITATMSSPLDTYRER